MTNADSLAIIYKKTSKGRKNAMKKLVSILLCVAMLCAVCVTAFAEGEPTTSASVAVGTVEGGKGEKVTLPVSITGNSGIASLTATITYDAAALSVTDKDVVPAGILAGAVDTADSSTTMYQVNTAEAGKIYISFIKTENITGDGVLFNIGFTIKADAAVGDSAVSITVEEMANADAAIYTGYTVAAGNVKIGEATFIYGDVDANGTVEATDALWALQAYVGSRQLVDNAFKAADVNLDNTVDTSDALAILQFAVKLRTELPIKK